MQSPVVHCGRFTLSPSYRILVLRYVDVDWEENHYEMSGNVVNMTKITNELPGRDWYEWWRSIVLAHPEEPWMLRTSGWLAQA